MKLMKKFLSLFLLLLLITAIAAATYNLNKKGQAVKTESWQDGNYFSATRTNLTRFSLPDIFDKNNEFSNEDLLGKYSMVNFFASWCTTCKVEHEVLMQIKKENIIDIYGVAWRDIDKNTKEYLEKHGNPFVKTASDSRGIFTEIGEINAVPESWIVDKNGIVIARIAGNIEFSTIAQIKKILAENK